MTSMEDKVLLLCPEETAGMEHENALQINETHYDDLLLKKETLGHKRIKSYDHSHVHHLRKHKNLSVPIHSNENSCEVSKTEDCVQNKPNKTVIYFLIVIFSAVAIILYQFDE